MRSGPGLQAVDFWMRNPDERGATRAGHTVFAEKRFEGHYRVAQRADGGAIWRR
jgi:hypothetical protein